MQACKRSKVPPIPPPTKIAQKAFLFRDGCDEESPSINFLSRLIYSHWLPKQGDINRICHGLVSGIVGMNVIAAIERWPDSFWVRRVEHNLFQVNHGIEGVAGANPLIKSLSLGFLLGAEHAGDRRCAAKGRLRRAEDFHAPVVRPLNELLHAGDQIIDANGFGGWRKLRAREADVDNAF